MKKQPFVVAVMLVDGREALVRRAIRSFQSQTYENRRLLIYDSGSEPVPSATVPGDPNIIHILTSVQRTIGGLRNEINGIAARGGADIIVHWDSDDWSAPERIEEQADWLNAAETSVWECVGMNRMVFWRETEREAWLYNNPNPEYALGTSLCYWTKTWRKNPFRENTGSESEFGHWFGTVPIWGRMGGEPPTVLIQSTAIIASIHAGNEHRQPYRRELMLASEAQGGEWKRAAHLDESTARIMAL
jgi:glycosyltransferase involved in cell wall biosynthesis